jgi:succinate dehydrogenase / fumarate reductase cytochrome b subunit
VSTAAVRENESHGAFAFVFARLGSLLSVLPLGVWVVVHLWHNLAAFQGAAAWQEAVTEHPHPIAEVITFVIVLVPLAWHFLWGATRTYKERPNWPRYGYYANFKFVLQRLSAIGLALFLGAHLWLAFIKPRFVERSVESFADLARQMHFHTPTLVVYALGIVAVAFHLANGLHTAKMGWGAVSSRTALRRMEVVIWGVFLLVLAMGGGAVYALYTAGAEL